MPKGGLRSGYEQRQGATEDQVPCPYLTLGGLREKVQLALPRDAISRKGTKNYLQVVAAYSASSRSACEWDLRKSSYQTMLLSG